VKITRLRTLPENGRVIIRFRFDILAFVIDVDELPKNDNQGTPKVA
jgi:hypothetical protein